MAETITKQILRNSLDFSYAEIEKEHPGWSKTAVDDYFYKQSNINTLAISSEGIEAQIVINTENIQANADNLTIHIDNANGAHAASAISYDNSISGLAAIEIQSAINEVDALVDANTTNITNLTTAFNTHNNSNSQHGVTGVNIGTEDYAQASTGGSVWLAALVADAVASTVTVASPDATDLATVLTLANETKVDVNQLVADLNAVVTQLNEFLANNKTAKQMAS